MVMAVGTVKLFEAPNEKEKEEPVCLVLLLFSWL
jgi:hypothetical protein